MNALGSEDILQVGKPVAVPPRGQCDSGGRIPHVSEFASETVNSAKHWRYQIVVDNVPRVGAVCAEHRFDRSSGPSLAGFSVTASTSLRQESSMFGKSLFVRKNRLAAPARYYGDGGTIHQTDHLDVEVHDGRVVAVWFRCQQLPFRAADVDARRAAEMDASHVEVLRLTGVELVDP